MIRSETERQSCILCSYSCACVLGAVFLALVIVLSIVVFSISYDTIRNEYYRDESDDKIGCDYTQILFGAAAFSYALIVCLIFNWCLFRFRDT